MAGRLRLYPLRARHSELVVSTDSIWDPQQWNDIRGVLEDKRANDAKERIELYQDAPSDQDSCTFTTRSGLSFSAAFGPAN